MQSDVGGYMQEDKSSINYYKPLDKMMLKKQVEYLLEQGMMKYPQLRYVVSEDYKTIQAFTEVPFNEPRAIEDTDKEMLETTSTRTSPIPIKRFIMKPARRKR